MRRVRIGHNSGGAFVEDESLTPSERGFDFQHRWTLAILRRLRGFATVTLRDMAGNVITEADYQRRGPDGGIDLMIEIEAASEPAAKAISTKVRNILLAMEIEQDGLELRSTRPWSSRTIASGLRRWTVWWAPPCAPDLR